MKKGKPCGKNQVKYSGVIGVLIKQYRRWNWEKPWNLQDDNAEDWLWSEIKARRVIGTSNKQRQRLGEHPGIPEEQIFRHLSFYRLGEQPSRHGPMPFIPLEKRQRLGEQPGRPEEQIFGPAEPLYRPGKQPNRHAATPFIPLDQRQRPQELLFGPAELLYISRDQLNRPQND
ncbi:uncharacterized protein LOC113306723 [Papaver somniferum]|nr:uncharacterized protein LOC113306723 [Papaver somniferum]